MFSTYSGEVTLRVTGLQHSFNQKWVRFRGVPVSAETHLKTSGKDFYNVKLPENILTVDLRVGQIWTLVGDALRGNNENFYGTHYETTHEFVAKTCKVIMPVSSRAFVEFIATDKQFEGIGPVYAEKLWEKFGASIFDILKNKDTEKLQQVLTERSAGKLIAGYEKYAYLKYSVWLDERQIPLPVQKRIFKFQNIGNNGQVTDAHGMSYSVDPIQLIQQNPYSLALYGLSFNETDKIAKKHFAVEDTDERRLIAAVTDVLRGHASKGHTVADHKSIAKPLKTLLRTDELTAKALAGSYDKRAFIIYPITGLYQYTATYVMENVVAKRFLKLNSLPVQFNEAENQACNEAFDGLPFARDKLAAQQIEAVLTSVESAISCITGGAGTGKTTVLNAVLTAYVKLGYNVQAMALSGRAAMRMRQSIHMPTSTIAKFMREDPVDNGKHLVVIDEASMLDLPTMYRIVTHIAPSVRILLVGDPHQLPPIGSGNILADVVSSRVIPNTALNIVKRQEGSTGIPEYSNSIKEGLMPPQLTTDNGCITFHETGYDFVPDVCVKLYKDAPESSQIVAATNPMVDKINQACQEEINPDGEQLVYEEGGQKYYDNLFQNDPVLFTKNNYDVGVQNGSLGRLISVEQTEESWGVVKLDDPMDDGDDIIELSPSLLLSLKPAYGITLHKAQGSQFPRVIIALTSGPNLDRAWLYTAVTRAESEIHIVGPREKIASAIKNVSNASKRQTYLKTLLQQGGDQI